MLVFLKLLLGLFLGKAAEAAFRNLRNKYGRERRKLKSAMRSGAGANKVKVQLSQMFPFLAWLEPYFVEWETTSSLELETSIPDDATEDDSIINDDTIENDDNASVASEVSTISAVTGKVQYRKRSR